MYTVFLKTLIENSQPFNYVTTVLISSAIGFLFSLISVYITYKLNLKKEFLVEKRKERKRLETLREFICFSSNKLIKATESQLEYLNEFKEQFISEEMGLKPISLNPNFDIDNFKISAQRNDMYEVFISKSKQLMKHRFRVYNDLVFSLKVTKKVSENMEEKMNKFILRQNELFEEFNTYNTELRKLINSYVEKKKSGYVTNSEGEFIEEVGLIHKDILKSGKIDNMLYAAKNFHKMILNLSIKYDMKEFINLVPEGINIYIQLVATRKFYYDIFDAFSKEMTSSKDCLKNVISFLDDEEK